jgi:predicted metal-dependent phosphoesterase TrpH
MRIKGALHMHSTLSRDGSLTIPELAAWYGRKGYSFIGLTEHSEDMDARKTEILREEGAKNSSPKFCVIAGIEFSSAGGLHIPAIGVAELIEAESILEIIREIRRRGGFAVLAHPKRIGWKAPPEILKAVDAVEIWNIIYDGKYLPSLRSLQEYRRMRAVNPALLAVAGHDFHRPNSFYDLAIEMEVQELSRETVLENLRQGAYTIRSRFFRADPQARTTWANATSLQVMSPALRVLRGVRSLFLRWSS